jgi:hypothetical protein
MLNAVDVGKNSTITYGNTKLETTTSEKYESFRWTYTYNGIEAPSKCVSLGYENGFLKYFVDNWDLYTIGGTEVKVSEEQAISTAMDQARTFSWNMGTGNSTLKVKDYNVANAMVWETLFCSNLDVATPRSQDPFMLYPIRHVWVSLDKFYPGNVYGFNVYVWADTGEVCYIHERVSTLNPPSDMVASVDDFTVEAVNDAAQLDTASIPWIMLPVLAFFTLATIPVWFLLGREKNSPRKRFSKLAGLLFCLLLFSFILFPVSTVNASSAKGRAEIWGAESTGGYDSRIPGSWKYWRKTSGEISWQQTLSQWIYLHFNSNGYDVSKSQGDDSLKNLILADVSYNEANYPRVAVVDFDHGVGTTTYVPGEWHYMFEDNVGTIIGAHPGEDGHDEHAVTDMDIYPRTAEGKAFFAFINTCMSANIDSTTSGYVSTQGIIPGTYRARGMPFAWTHHKVGYGFSSNGYSSPDSGDFCYIGFPRGSAALDQPISNGTYTLMEYAGWVYEFFVAALDEDVSVINAMDIASIECFTVPFYNTPLDNGFTANWPTWDPEQGWHDNIWPPEGSDRLVVYGNGNIHLHQDGGVWNFDETSGTTAHDIAHGNNGTLYNGASWFYPKIGARSVHFDGNNDYMGVPSVSGLTGNTPHSIEAWVRVASLPANRAWILQLGNAGTGSHHWLIKSTGATQFGVYNGGQTQPSLPVGKWTHIAMTFDGTTLKSYVNGALSQSVAATFNLQGTPLTLAKAYNGENYFNGEIDELHIYDYVLSAGQIADNAAVTSLHFDGGDYAYDSSPFGNTGTVSGAEWDNGLRTSSGFSYGLSFDNYDYVNVPDSSSLDITDAVTVEAWIKPARLDVWQSPLEKGADNDWAYGFYIEPAGGNIGFEIGKEGSTVTWAGAVAPVNSYLAVGKWSHIVGTADTATHKVCLYIDGVKVPNEGYISGQINTNSIPFQIGKRSDGGYFEGIIDEVRIYDRALSSSEISSYYAANKPVHWLTVSTVLDPYGATIYPWIKIDGYYTDVLSVTHGTSHTVEVEDPWYFPYLGYFEFDRFTYDSTTNTQNPMTIYVYKDTEITAHYTLSGW